jgi:hypothetical protein
VITEIADNARRAALPAFACGRKRSIGAGNRFPRLRLGQSLAGDLHQA